MKNHHNNVWTGVDQLSDPKAFREQTSSEFTELPVVESLTSDAASQVETNRRDFLKYLGFSIGTAAIASSCEIPVRKAIPYVVKPDAIVPGVATYYASTFVKGGDFCPVLVKTREGRPIKVEGNSMSSITGGGTSARAQASILDLYDTNRFSGPLRVANGRIQLPRGKRSGPSWEEIDSEIKSQLNPDSRIRIVSHTLMSPTAKKAIADFKKVFPNTEHAMYDPISSSAMIQANEQDFGQAAVPSYRFDQARVIVAFEADFLGTWISPIEFAAQYARNRRIKDVHHPEMSRHIQVESHMSLTGSNADNRILVKPSEQGAALIALYNEVADLAGQVRVLGPQVDPGISEKMSLVARELFDHRGESLVVSGSNNVGEQMMVNGINAMLNNYGSTIDFSRASMQRQGLDGAVQQLITDMNANRVDAVFFMEGANPAYDLPNAEQFRTALAKVPLKVSFATQADETALLCDFITPTHHYLESWGDVEVKRGHYGLVQPAIAPIFASVGKPGTRQTEESLLRWAESDELDTESEQPFYEYLKSHWESAIFSQTGFFDFQKFWDSALHDGVVEIDVEAISVTYQGDATAAAGRVRQPSGAELEIAFFETVNMGHGQYANNPWLQEMPDPIARTVWGNYLAVPVSWDGGNEFKSFKGLNSRELYGQADKVNVEVNGRLIEGITAVRQFGQMQDTVSLALGFGRSRTGDAGKALANQVGTDVFPWLTLDEYGNTQYYATVVDVSDKVDVEKHFACVQYHHGMGMTARDENGELIVDEASGKPLNVDEKTNMTLTEGYQGSITERSIIYKANLKEIEDLVHKIEHRREEAAHLNEATLYPAEEYQEQFYSQGHHWGMHVDLNACIGCGACQVACIAENNVPVVGKREVARHHEMTWLRIDRYFYGDYENPNVVYQPMMCQHCDNAPCENVCPVAATNHSGEGLNQMTYNRCIGTRYCANNCPYKVRRFNWLDYTTADTFAYNEYNVGDEEVPFGADNLTRMVLNPDVTVRSRGVIEKCSFCVQRIQEGKLTAKREGRKLEENDVKTACQTACPTEAIVFGDMNDKNSTLAKRLDNELNYKVLEETNVDSSVMYSAKVINRREELDA